MKKIRILQFLFIFFLLIVPLTVAITFNNTDPDGDLFESDNSAMGSIAERDANDTSTGTEAIVFSWGGPIGNGSNGAGVSASELGIAASSDIFVITFGPDFSTDVAVEATTESAEATEASGIASGGGGGGGSSSRETYGLVVGDELTVIVAGGAYTIAIDSVTDKSAGFTLVETGESFTLEVGESTELSVDSDSTVEMSITLDQVSELRRVIITIQDLTEITTEEGDTIEETDEGVDAEPLEAITGMVTGGADALTGAIAGIDAEQLAAVKGTVRTTSRTAVTYILGINILMGLMLSSLFTAKHIKKRKIYKAFHQESKTDHLEHGFTQMRDYTKQALEHGHSYQKIRYALLNVGWLPEEVDEILVDAMLNQGSRLGQCTKTVPVNRFS